MERLTMKSLRGVDLKDEYDIPCSDVCERNISCETCSIQKAFDKLAHYEDLEEQGLLLKLPCRTGDTIYDISTSDILSYKVESFKMLRNRVVSMRTSYIINDTILFSRSYVDDIGKTVFLTKAEAEKALAEMEK